MATTEELIKDIRQDTGTLHGILREVLENQIAILEELEKQAKEQGEDHKANLFNLSSRAARSRSVLQNIPKLP